MSWVRKNGGVISVYYSVLLGITGFVVATAVLQAATKKEIAVTSDQRQIRHLIYVEMLYYIRNEIYDGYYSGLEYESNGWHIRVKFKKKERLASLLISSEGFEITHRFLYDTDCRCILEGWEEGEVEADEMEWEEVDDH